MKKRLLLLLFFLPFLLVACQPATKATGQNQEFVLQQALGGHTLQSHGTYVLAKDTLVISKEFQTHAKLNEVIGTPRDANWEATKETILTEFPEAKPNDDAIVQSFSRELPAGAWQTKGEELIVTAKNFRKTFTFTDQRHRQVKDGEGNFYDFSVK